MNTVPPSTVGRAQELDALIALLDGGAGGGVVVLEGEAGIGKTTLLRLATDLARQQDHRVAWAAGDDLVAEAPMGLLARALAGIDPLGHAPSISWPEPTEAADPSAALDQGGVPSDVVDQFVDLLERVGSEGPLVVVLDDAQWADEASMMALPAIARRSASLGISFLVALRPLPRLPNTARSLAALERGGATLITLGPLPPDDVGRLTTALLGRGPTDREQLMVAGAGGNPYLIELVLADVGDGRTTAGASTTIGKADGEGEEGAAVPVPVQVRELVMRRLDAEGPAERSALTTAALMGRWVDLADLAGIETLGARELESLVSAALTAGWFEDVDERIRFRHDLIREAIVAATPEPVRRLIHGRIAAAAELRGQPAAIVAHNLAQAFTPPDAEALRRILELSPGLARPIARDVLAVVLGRLPPDDPDRAAVVVAHCHHVVWGDNPDLGERLAREALLWVTEPALVYELLASRSYALFQLGRPREAFESWEASRRRAGASISAFEHAQMSAAKLFAGDIEGASISAAIAVNDPDVPRHGVRTARAVRAWIAATQGDHRTALEETGIALDDALAHPDEQRLPHDVPQLYRAVMLDATGQGQQALTLLRQDFPATANLGSASVDVLRHASTAMLLYRLGNWDEALAEAEAGDTLSRDAGVAIGVGWLTGVQALVALHRGEPDVAARVLADQPTHLKGPTLGMEWMAYAKASLDQVRGDSALALATLKLTIDMAMASGLAVSVTYLGIDACRLALPVGDVETITNLRGQVEEVAGRSTMPTARAAHDHLRALVDADVDGLATTAATIAAFPRPWEAGRCWHDAAVAAAKAGDKAGARRHAGLAIDQYEIPGAAGSIARLRTELRDLGVRIRRSSASGDADIAANGGGQDDGSGWERLTATETVVVGLVGEGLSNAQIAERLFVSRRTVESHLGRAYQKLSVPTRSALVAFAASRGASG